MSIDHLFDAYTQDKGIIPDAEVIPDHPCQVFDTYPLAASKAADEADGTQEGEAGALAAARDTVQKILRG